MNIRIGKFTAVEPSGTWTGGPPYYEPTILDWQLLDQMGAQAVDGDHGGCWAPLTTIIINGNLDVIGPTLVLGQGTMTSNIAGAWELQGSPVPQFPQLSDTHIGRSRVIVTSCSSGRAALPYGAAPFLFGLQAVAQSFVNLDANGNLSSVDRNTLFVPIRVHNGATLSSVAVSFALTQDHIVTNPPAFRVVRVDNFGGQVPLTSVAAGAVNVSGYVQPTGITYNNGFAQTATVTCDQNNVIDITNYSYVLEIIEEQDQVGYPYVLAVTTPASLASAGTTTILSTTGQTVDGQSAASVGEVILVKDNVSAQSNGLWSVQSGLWTRPLVPLFQGMIVPVAQGTVNGGTYWQLQSPPPFVLGVYGNWVASTVFYVGQVVVPISLGGSFAFMCTVGGESDVAEPVWPTATGQTVIDGSSALGAVTSSGTTPPVVSFTGSPAASYQPIQILIDGAGARGTATFTWKLNGIVQAAAVLTAATVSLTGTGLTAVFATGTNYSLNNVYTASTTGPIVWTALPNPASELLFSEGPLGGASTLVPTNGDTFVAQGTLYLQAAATFIDIVDTRFQ